MQALPYISFVPSATIGWLLQVCLDTAFQCVFSVSLDAEHSRRGGGGGGCGGGGGESLIKDLKRSANSLSRDTRQASALGLADVEEWAPILQDDLVWTCVVLHIRCDAGARHSHGLHTYLCFLRPLLPLPLARHPLGRH